MEVALAQMVLVTLVVKLARFTQGSACVFDPSHVTQQVQAPLLLETIKAGFTD